MPRSRSGARNGRPPRTSRAEILAAAQRVIDDEGWQRLTIRRLAVAAGTSPATVYYHVRDKDDVLVQLLNDYADRLPRPDLPRNPRERIAAAATLIHDVLAERPWIVEVLSADDLLGESALWMVEAILSGAIQAGARPQQAVHLYRNIWYFTVGEILVRASSGRRRARTDRAVYRDEAISGLDHTDHPHLADLAPRWAALTAEDTYADGVRALIEGSLSPSR